MRPASFVWTNTLTRLDPLAVGILLARGRCIERFARRAMTRISMLVGGLATMLMVSAWCDPYWSPNSGADLVPRLSGGDARMCSDFPFVPRVEVEHGEAR